VSPDVLTSSLSRRALLAAGAGLGIAAGLGPNALAAQTPVAAASDLRDFATVGAALMLAVQEREDLRPLAGIQYQPCALALTPDTLKLAGGFSPAQARDVFDRGAVQATVQFVKSEDQSRILFLDVIQTHSPPAAQAMLPILRAHAPDGLSNQMTPALATGADDAYLVTYEGPPFEGAPLTHHFLHCGLRLGTTTVRWMAGTEDAPLDVALAATINRVLADELNEDRPSVRRVPSLAFLTPFVAYPIIKPSYLLVAGQPLLEPGLSPRAAQQLVANPGGVINMMRLISNTIHGKMAITLTEELPTAEQARAYRAEQLRAAPAQDAADGVARFSVPPASFTLIGWDAWEASVVSEQIGELEMRLFTIDGLTGPFRVQAQVGGIGAARTGTAASDFGDAESRLALDLATQLLAPLPAAAQRASDPAARMHFPEPVQPPS
jgi:hypothetical protein